LFIGSRSSVVTWLEAESHNYCSVDVWLSSPGDPFQ
jgi:hypothetical protein